LVTHECLKRKEHNDSTFFYLIDLELPFSQCIGYSWLAPEITKHYLPTAMHYLEESSS